MKMKNTKMEKMKKKKKVPIETRKKEKVGVEWTGAAVTLLFTPRRLLELTLRP